MQSHCSTLRLCKAHNNIHSTKIPIYYTQAWLFNANRKILLINWLRTFPMSIFYLSTTLFDYTTIPQRCYLLIYTSVECLIVISSNSSAQDNELEKKKKLSFAIKSVNKYHIAQSRHCIQHVCHSVLPPQAAPADNSWYLVYIGNCCIYIYIVWM